MADLSVTIGLDQTELEKGLAGAGKSIGNMGGGAAKNPFQDTANKFQSAAGIGGMIAGPIGALAGSFIDAWRFAIDKVLDYVKELIAYATKLRNLSIATGVSASDLSQLALIAEVSGTSIETMAHAMSEFNKRMAEARIKGSEVNNILVKLGVGMDEVANGSFDAVAGMKALAAAHEAGTDAMTLAYYGNKMFGSSFEQLLPVIKRGAAQIDEFKLRTLEQSEVSIDALARLSDTWNLFWHNFKVVMLTVLGDIVAYLQWTEDTATRALIAATAVVSKEKAGQLAEKILNPSHTPEQRKKILEDLTGGMSKEDKKLFMDAYNKAAGGEGKKLSPFGLSEAGAASTLQSMGGGDIFGAVAFTPLERIATATEKTAENTNPDKDETNQRPSDTPAR